MRGARKYIAVDAFKEHVETNVKVGTFYSVNQILEFADATPAADVVEITRCVDCAYSEELGRFRRCICHRRLVDDSDFCSDGNKKGE